MSPCRWRVRWARFTIFLEAIQYVQLPCTYSPLDARIIIPCVGNGEYGDARNALELSPVRGTGTRGHGFFAMFTIGITTVGLCDYVVLLSRFQGSDLTGNDYPWGRFEFAVWFQYSVSSESRTLVSSLRITRRPNVGLHTAQLWDICPIRP